MLANHDADYVRLIWVIGCAVGFSAIVALAIIYWRALRRHEIEMIDEMISLHDREADREADRAPDPLA